MTDSKASMLMRWKIASRRMPALFTTPSSLPNASIAVFTILLAGMASATVSKLATAVPPRFLISSATSSAGAALEPEPSAATPGSLTTTLAPSAAQSSAISRPMPRPAPVTMMDLPSSDFVMVLPFLRTPGCALLGASPESITTIRGHGFRARAQGGTPWNDGVLLLIRKNNRAGRREHAADAVAYGNLRVLDLRRRDAAHLPHAL